MSSFSDLIVFADETGDHGMQSIDPAFPMFGLAFCVLSKADYIGTVVPEFQKLKFEFWGHDGVVLHEHDIRKEKGDFALLRTNKELRELFHSRISAIIESVPVTVHAAIIQKERLKQRYAQPWNPYDIALLFCMERLQASLLQGGQAGRTVHVIFEGRGRVEDAQLELTFRRITANQGSWGNRAPDFGIFDFIPRFEKKASNAIGLQFADLVARPVALSFMRPNQPNRAVEILRSKPGDWKCFPS